MDKRILCLILIGIGASPARAFDNDIAINEPNFKMENYLDLQAVEYRQSLRQQWYYIENGFRFTAGSVDADRLSLASEFRFSQPLSPSVDMRIHHEEVSYYAVKPYLRPLFEAAIHPWRTPFEFSLVGTPTYDKRQSDLGYVLSYGGRTENYVRYRWIKQDYFYNDKNDFDDTFYEQNPVVTGLEGDYRGQHWHLRAAWEESQPMRFLDPGEGLDFTHRGSKWRAVLDYHYRPGRLYGMEYEFIETEKTLSEGGDLRGQRLTIRGVNFYWSRFARVNYEITLGLRVDDFENRVNEQPLFFRSYDYYFYTGQLYGNIYHRYGPNKAWDYGLYFGRVKEHRAFDTVGTAWNDVEWEAKLRTSWEYRATDGSSALTIHFGFNLDNLIDDPGDGAGATYQAWF